MRIKANWCGSLSCVPRRAKIKLFNYCQVHLIRKQADDLTRCNNCDLVVLNKYLFFLTVPFLSLKKIVVLVNDLSVVFPVSFDCKGE